MATERVGTALLDIGQVTVRRRSVFVTGELLGRVVDALLPRKRARVLPLPFDVHDLDATRLNTAMEKAARLTASGRRASVIAHMDGENMDFKVITDASYIGNSA